MLSVPVRSSVLIFSISGWFRVTAIEVLSNDEATK